MELPFALIPSPFRKLLILLNFTLLQILSLSLQVFDRRQYRLNCLRVLPGAVLGGLLPCQEEEEGRGPTRPRHLRVVRHGQQRAGLLGGGGGGDQLHGGAV